MTRLGWVLLVVTVPALAAADPDHFVTMDRQDASSRAGVEVSKLFYPDSTTTNGLSGLRFDIHGQYITPNAIGIYLTAPIGHISGTGDSETALGDVEVGGVFIPQLADSNMKLVIHAGLTLPTQSKDLNPLLTSAYTMPARLADYYLIVPEGLSLRAGVSPIIKSGQVFFRGDLGFDANLSAADGSDAKNALRVNAGAGLDLGVAAVMVESTNLYVSGNNGGWVNSGAVSARFDGGSVYPYAAIVVGLDDDIRQIMEEAVTVGLEGRLR
jgi:hypothetical protein